MHAGVKYRPDIDGLRALAVLAVVFYHFNINRASGGFVGVDIFFVISGYLITQVIYSDVKSGTYTVSRFYERRIRRILPAYLFVAVCSAIFVAIFDLPAEVESFKNSLITATLFVSNIYFYMTADYFNPASEVNPLLHTWSLAVEEQFYILFPLFLWIARARSSRHVAVLILLLAAISLGVSAFLVSQNREAAFYLIHSRAWELLLGSFLAIGPVRAPSSRVLRETMAGIGLALILFSIFKYRVSTPFPGLAALAPCIGSALILQSGGASTVGKLLSIWPVRFVGLISYSLYLWHWPVWVFAKDYLLIDITHTTKIALFLFSIGLATFSWWFVERPFRTQRFKLRGPKLFVASACAMGQILLISGTLSTINASTLELPPSADRVLAVANDASVRDMRVGVCFITSRSDNFDQYDKSKCLQLSAAKKNYLLLGDSHAAHLWSGLSHADPSINILQATASGCKPIIGGDGLERCRRLMKFVFEDFLPTHHLDGIIISARWKKEDVEPSIETAHRLEKFADRVVIFGPTVEYKIGLPKLLALASAREDASLVDRSRLSDQREIDRMFERSIAEDSIGYFSVYEALCSGGHCRVLDDNGLPIAFDYGHLTVNGSAIVAAKAAASGTFGSTAKVPQIGKVQ